MQTAKIKADVGIICDDVRREATGKIFLIGVWPLELAVASYPTDVAMMFHCEGAVLQSGHIKPRLFVRDEIGSVFYDSDKFEKMPEGRFIVGRFSLDFNVEFQAARSCTLRFILTMGDEEHIVAERHIDILDNFKARRSNELKKLGVEDPESE